jgi:hypothetical protein
MFAAVIIKLINPFSGCGLTIGVSVVTPTTNPRRNTARWWRWW